MAAGTLVVRLDTPRRVRALDIPPDLGPLPLSREQLAKLGDHEQRLIRGALRRAEGDDDDPRSRALLRASAEAMIQRLGLDPSQTDPPLTLLRRLHLTLLSKR